MRRSLNWTLALVVGVAFGGFTAGCTKTEKVTVEGKRGKETTVEVEKDRQGNVTSVNKDTSRGNRD